MREDTEGWAALDTIAIVREMVSRLQSICALAMDAGTREGAIRWRPEFEQSAIRSANVFVRDYLAHSETCDKVRVFRLQTHFVCCASGYPGVRPAPVLDEAV